MKNIQIISFLLILIGLLSAQAKTNNSARQLPMAQESDSCHYSCYSCTSSSDQACTECIDTSRGYDGIPGYLNTCYCLGDQYESFTSQCDSYNSENKTIDITIAIGLWIVFPTALVVSAFGNQMMGFYCIDTIQVIGYYYYVTQMFPSTIQNSLYYMRYYSLSNVNTLMRSSFLKNYKISNTEQKQYVIVDEQTLSDAKYTYLEISANMIYNGSCHLIAILTIYALFAILLVLYLKYPQTQSTLLTQVYKARKTITLRVYQFFVGDLFLFATMQCTNIVFTTPMGSMGFILAVMVFLLLWVGFAYGFYMVNMNKAKFEDKDNQVFFNKLKKNDKINRNFYTLQVLNKMGITLFLNIFMNSYELQITAVMIISTIFSLITVMKIRLKKKRHQFFLFIINVCKLAINSFMLMFAYSSNNSKITAGWLFEVSVLITLMVMILYLFIEGTSQLPDIIMFVRSINFTNCLGSKQNNMISLEMQQCNYLSQTKTIQNKIYCYFESENAYEKVVNDYLDQYHFDMPEEDENEENQTDQNLDDENPENVEISLDDPNNNINNNNNNDEEEMQNEFDPEEYLKQTNN